jgi:hypothetical protein
VLRTNVVRGPAIDQSDGTEAVPPGSIRIMF